MPTTALALDHLLRAVGDPVADLRCIGPDHPEFVRAQAIVAAAGVLAKVPGAFPAIADAIRAAASLPKSPPEASHFAAAGAWIRGDPVLAAETYAFLLSRWPQDVLALRLAQSCYFFLGRHERLCALVDAVMGDWDPCDERFGFVLAMASFAHAENGNAAYAEALGRRALAQDGACPLGVHAVAHAIAESGRPGSGARWMREQSGHWARDSRMRTHNAWHLAMFDVEHGDLASALDVLDKWLIPASETSALDACDAAGLLFELESRGIVDRGRWGRVSDAFERTAAPGFWPYVDLHAALAHFRAGDEVRAKRLEQAIDRHAKASDCAGLRARRVTRPGLAALRAWAEGRHAKAARAFAALRPFLGDAGGSRVQLALFERIERDAVRRRAGLRAAAAHGVISQPSYG
ncbi:MAG TPA: hypothetical protein VMN56_19455 [Casimicrobiaceae bacterium]|nr:hypothetical protein [Casimicrobiaceae bacterium]